MYNEAIPPHTIFDLSKLLAPERSLKVTTDKSVYFGKISDATVEGTDETIIVVITLGRTVLIKYGQELVIPYNQNGPPESHTSQVVEKLKWLLSITGGGESNIEKIKNMNHSMHAFDEFISKIIKF